MAEYWPACVFITIPTFARGIELFACERYSSPQFGESAILVTVWRYFHCDDILIFIEYLNILIMKKLFFVVALFISLQAFSQGQVQRETAGGIAFAQSQIMMLVQAIPADKFAWTPGAGVRSVSEVCAHIIGGNYLFATRLGAKAPAELTLESLEKDLKTKEACIAELKRSFEILSTAIKGTKDDALATKVEFPFPGEYTMMSAMLISMGHANEHLGQLIAYARMNSIVPPWSEKK